MSVTCVGRVGSGKTHWLSLLTHTVDIGLTRATVGVNYFEWEGIEIREIGGALAPIWHDYLNDERNNIGKNTNEKTLRGLVYFVDVSDSFGLSESAVELVKCVSHVSNNCGSCKRLLIVFSKADLADQVCVLNKKQIKDLLGLESIKAFYEHLQISEIDLDLDKEEAGKEALGQWLKIATRA